MSHKKNVILAKNNELIKTGNCEYDNTEKFQFKKAFLEINESDDNNEKDPETEGDVFEDSNDLPCVENCYEKFEDDALEYVAGYIIKKWMIHNFESNHLEEGHIWVDEISKGGLKKPNSYFF